MQTYLAYLTRLRQAVAHLYLIEGVLQTNFTLEDFRYLRRQLAQFPKTPMHEQMRRWTKMEYDGYIPRDGETATFGRSRFGDAFDMDFQLEDMEVSKTLQDVSCRICYDSPVDPRITEVCGH